MPVKFREGFLVLILAALAACTWRNPVPAPIHEGATAATSKKLYVVRPADDDGIGSSIVANLERRGYEVASGPEHAFPADAAVKVRYSGQPGHGPLSIVFHDPRNGMTLASGTSDPSMPGDGSPDARVDTALDRLLTP